MAFEDHKVREIVKDASVKWRGSFFHFRYEVTDAVQNTDHFMSFLFGFPIVA
jgi:hypothetical protein